MNRSIAIVAIVQNEEPFIKEWVAYHTMIGIDHFFLYDNGNTPNLEVILKDFADRVTITPIQDKLFEVVPVHYRAYTDAKQNKADQYEWLSFLDVDEFIVLNEYSTIHEFLEAFTLFDQILLHRKNFGHNGHYYNPKKTVLESHIFREADKKYRAVKSIIKTQSSLHGKTSAHYTSIKTEGITVDTAKRQHEAFHHLPAEEHAVYTAHINHYPCRSFLQYAQAQKRRLAIWRWLNWFNRLWIKQWKQHKEAIMQEFVESFSFECNMIKDTQMLQYVEKVKSHIPS